MNSTTPGAEATGVVRQVAPHDQKPSHTLVGGGCVVAGVQVGVSSCEVRLTSAFGVVSLMHGCVIVLNGDSGVREQRAVGTGEHGHIGAWPRQMCILPLQDVAPMRREPVGHPL